MNDGKNKTRGEDLKQATCGSCFPSWGSFFCLWFPHHSSQRGQSYLKIVAQSTILLLLLKDVIVPCESKEVSGTCHLHPDW